MSRATIGRERIRRSTVLTCLECEARSDEQARGWRALVPYDFEGDQQPDLSLYCPSCAEREFGPSRVERATR